MVRQRAIAARPAASRLAVCLLPAALCLLAAGCQNGRRLQADLYQRELRLQEDEIYRLEDYIEEYQAIISGYRCEIADLKRELAASQPAAAKAGRAPTVRAADDEASLLEIPEPTDLGPPPDEPLPAGEEIAPPFNPGAGNGSESLESAPLFEGAATEFQRGPERAVTLREPAPLRQTSAAVAIDQRRGDDPPNPYPTAASLPPRSIEPAPEEIGDPSIRLSVEAADDSLPSLVAVLDEAAPNALRRFDGEVSVMLTDPSEDGRAKRIARWDFTAAEVKASRGADPDRLALTIALPSESPTDRPLRLWVRLVGRDGARKLQATSVRFLANPLRLAENESLAGAAMLMRLPSSEEQGVSQRTVVQAGAEGWRRPALERRIDRSVAPASYESW